MREIKFRTFVKNEGKMIYGREAMAVKQFTPNYAYLDSEVEVMQWTGLKDKNGKDIYESDVLSTGNYVKFEDGAFWTYNKKGSQENSIYSHTYYQKNVEVIGNIFENPELFTS